MANPYYDHGSVPATGSTGSSASMRAEFDAVEAGFDKLPTLSGYGNKAVVVNAGGTALTTTSGSMSLAGDLTLAGALTTSGAYGLTLTLTALTSLTLPTSGTLATLAGTETLTNKTLNLTSNTLAGTIAQFNAACSDADFATVAGTETLTNKTLTSPAISGPTLSGTILGTYTLGGTPTIPGVLVAGTSCVQNPVTTSTATTQAHGLASAPTLVVVYLECLTAELGYSIGDRVFMQFKDNGAGNFGYMVEWDATNVRILQGSAVPQLLNRATPGAASSITAANWKIVAVPYRLT